MTKEIILIFNNIANFNKEQYIMLFISIIIAYVIGSISPAMIISKLNGIDIRKEGSGIDGYSKGFLVEESN